MELLKTIGREAVGLFVADTRFVAVVLFWIAAVVCGLRAALISPTLTAVLLALGIAILLVLDVLPVARKTLRRKD